MRIANILKWAVLAVAILVAAVAAMLYSIDVNSYRDEIATVFRKATGRDLAIGGDIDLSISLSPAVVVERVAIANADWGSHPHMIVLERVEAEIEVLPLLAGDIRVTRLILVEPDILLETNSDGLSNWQATPPADDRSAEKAERKDEAGDGPQSVPVFTHVEIHRGRLTYKDARTGDEMQLDLDRGSARAASFGVPLAIDAEGAWNGTPFSIVGTLDSLARLAAGQPVELALDAEVFGFVARLSGVVAEPGKFADLDLRIAVRGADLSTLAPLAGSGLPKLGPVAFDARVEGSADKLQIEDLEAALASSDLSGRIDLSLTGPRPRLTGTLASNRIDLAELRQVSAGSGRPSATGSGARRQNGQPDRVFPDDLIPLDGFNAADLDVTLSVEKLTGYSVPVSAVRARMYLDNGSLEIKPFSATVAGSQVEGELRLDTGRATPGLRLVAGAAELDVGRLLAESGVTDLFEGKAKASVDLAGSGESVAALMASLDGDINLVVGNSRLKTQAFDSAVGGASAVLGTLFSGGMQWTVVNCALASIDIEQGRATSQLALIDTEYSIVSAKGTANLASETLDLVVEPQAKSATLNIAVPVLVGGTFANPEFRPEPGATLKKLGGLVGIVLFPPAAIVGLGELGGSDNECMRIATTSTASQAGPASPEKAVRELGDDLKGVVEEIGRGLEGLFGGNQD